MHDIIKNEIAKRKYKWSLSSLAWLDWTDVSSIIMIHVWKKFPLWKQNFKIEPWLNQIISNQIKNLIRNVYGNYSRPCLRCDAAEGEGGCKIWKSQCNNCPLYAEWQKKKLPAQNIKVPVSIENHPNEANNLQDANLDSQKNIEKIHAKMKSILKPVEYKVYEGLFILEENEEVIAKKLGYISNEKGRKAGYGSICNIVKIIRAKLKKCMEEGELDIN